MLVTVRYIAAGNGYFTNNKVYSTCVADGNYFMLIGDDGFPHQGSWSSFTGDTPQWELISIVGDGMVYPPVS